MIREATTYLDFRISACKAVDVVGFDRGGVIGGGGGRAVGVHVGVGVGAGPEVPREPPEFFEFGERHSRGCNGDNGEKHWDLTERRDQ